MTATLFVFQRPQADGSLGPCNLAAVRLFMLVHLAIRTKFQCEILLAVKDSTSQNEVGAESVSHLTLAWDLFNICPKNRTKLIVIKTGSLGNGRP
jgi:hypothetical protein